jgi:L-malate glycosyltransferase
MGRRFDVVDCCGFPFFSTFSARLCVAIRGGSLVSTWHEVWGRAYWVSYLGRLGLVGDLVERLAARVPDHIIAVSTATAQRLKDDVHGGLSVSVVPNGVDVERITAVSATQAPCDVVYAGRLCDFKDVELLLRAVALLARTRPELTCRIVGGGPHRASLDAAARDLQIEERVEFTGPLPDDEQVYAALASARVFVLPSQREGFGIVVLEANSVGIPVVVAAHPHNKAVDLVGEQNGVVVPPDADSLASAIADLLDEPRGARAQACRESARDYDWNGLALRYGSILQEAIA